MSTISTRPKSSTKSRQKRGGDNTSTQQQVSPSENAENHAQKPESGGKQRWTWLTISPKELRMLSLLSKDSL